MIRATAGTWANYASSFLFYIVFAATFGTSPEASAFAIAFSLAVAVSGVFVTTALSVIVPRMLTNDGSISQRAVRAMSALMLGATILAAGVLVLGLLAPTSLIEMLLPGDPATGRVFLAVAAGLVFLLALAGMLGYVALGRGHRFYPAVAPAAPSTAGALYLVAVAEPTTLGALVAMTVGAALQAVVAGILAATPRPRIVETAHLRTRSLAAWMFILLLGLSLLTPLQRVVASAVDPSGAAQLDYAYRGLAVVLQLMVGGAAMARLADWSRARRQPHRVRDGVSRVTALAALLLVVAGAAIALAAQPLVGLVLERGAFGAADTQAVATLLVILVPGFVAEGLTIVLTQGLLATRFTAVVLRVNLGRLILQLVLLIALGQLAGVVGVAWSYSIALAATLALTSYGAARIGLFRGRSSLMARAAGAAAMVAVAAVALAQLGSTWAIASSIGVVAVGVVAWFAFGLGELLPEAWRGRLRTAGGRA